MLKFRSSLLVLAAMFTGLAASAWSAPNILMYAVGGWVLTENVSPDYAKCTNFGTVQSSGGEKQYNYYIVNTGDANLVINSVNITGSGASHFSVVSGPGPSVVAGGFTSFKVKYAPTSNGTHNAKVSVGTNAPSNSIFEFNISGKGNNSEVDQADASIGLITELKSKTVVKKGITYLKAQYMVPINNFGTAPHPKKSLTLRVLASSNNKFRDGNDIPALKDTVIKKEVLPNITYSRKINVKLPLPDNTQRIIFELVSPDDMESNYGNNMRFEFP